MSRTHTPVESVTSRPVSVRRGASPASLASSAPLASPASPASFARPASFAPVAARLFTLASVVGLVGMIASGTAACGSRGPLDDDAPLDGGATTADVGTAEVGPDDATPPTPDAPEPVKDAAPEAGSIIGCGTCLIGQCSQGILACVQDAACQKTFQCVVTTCVSSGTPDPACLFKCASGDVQGALKIFTIFQCVTGKCGSDCNSVLTGLLGGLGGGGGGGAGGGGAGGGGAGGGPPPPPKSEAREMTPFAQAVSLQWPQLCAPVSAASAPPGAPTPTAAP
jgi:hypothetical protein